MAKVYSIAQKINSIFGVLTIDVNDKLPVAVDDTYAKGFGVRETGLAKEILKIDAHKKALADPNAWLTDKQNKLKAIGEKAGVAYLDSYKVAFERGLNEKDSEKFAEDAMNHIKKLSMEQHNAEFPPEITGQIWKKLKK